MNDADAETPIDAETPADAAPAPRRWNWQPKVRWFAAEFFVVVTGILVALALNAWWSGREAEARETVYLRQLVADLSETERMMASRDSSMARGPHHSVDQLIISFGTTPRPPRDSVATWLLWTAYTVAPRPVLGTAEALVASGDINLIRDDSLRAAILRYLDISRERMAYQEMAYIMAQASVTELETSGLSRSGAAEPIVDFHVADWLRPKGIRLDTTGHTASPDWQYPFPYDVMDIYESQDFLDNLTLLNRHLGGLQNARTAMSRNAVALREQVTRTMGE
jgi:hypothetical protein